jgi:hypothetical protein
MRINYTGFIKLVLLVIVPVKYLVEVTKLIFGFTPFIGHEGS